MEAGEGREQADTRVGLVPVYPSQAGVAMLLARYERSAADAGELVGEGDFHAHGPWDGGAADAGAPGRS